MPDSNPRLEAALRYAALGWHVVPLHTPKAGGGCTCRKGLACGNSAGKHPRVTNWQDEATTDEEKIIDWWEQWPEANVGVAFGPSSGIIDIETDSPEQERLLLDLFDGVLPVCPTFTSGRGKHRLFRYRVDLPGGATIYYGDLGIRTGSGEKGSQSVFPPSIHASGKLYEWLPGCSPDEVEPPDLPDKVATKIWNMQGMDTPEGNGKPKSARKALYEQEAVPEGSRDNTLYAEACALWNEQHALHGPDAFDREPCRRTVWERLSALNVTKCRPPLPEADVIAKVDGAAAWIKQQTEREARNDEVVTHPATGAPVGWRLVIVDGEPPIYYLWSPYWSGHLELSSDEFLTFVRIRRAAAAQKSKWVPTTLGRLWKDGKQKQSLASTLMDAAEHREAPAALRRPAQVAEFIWDFLAKGRTADDDDEPQNNGEPWRTKDGSVWFSFKALKDHAAWHKADKFTVLELSKCIKAAGGKIKILTCKTTSGTERTSFYRLPSEGVDKLRAAFAEREEE